MIDKKLLQARGTDEYYAREIRWHLAQAKEFVLRARQKGLKVEFKSPSRSWEGFNPATDVTVSREL